MVSGTESQASGQPGIAASESAQVAKGSSLGMESTATGQDCPFDDEAGDELWPVEAFCLLKCPAKHSIGKNMSMRESFLNNSNGFIHRLYSSGSLTR